MGQELIIGRVTPSQLAEQARKSGEVAEELAAKIDALAAKNSAERERSQFSRYVNDAEMRDYFDGLEIDRNDPRLKVIPIEKYVAYLDKRGYQNRTTALNAHYALHQYTIQVEDNDWWVRFPRVTPVEEKDLEIAARAINQIARIEGRKPGEVLRDIERAMA